MRSREPPAAPGLMRNIMSRQEATPSKQVCQEKRLKVGLRADRERRALETAQNHIITSAPAQNLALGPKPFHCCYFHPSSGDTGSSFSHRKLGAEAHSRLRQDKSTAA